MSDMKLVALDLDGTLFNNESKISEGNMAAIREAIAKGVHVVISTGRPYQGLPFSQIEGSGIAYAITTNGSAVYKVPQRECIFSDAMDQDLVCPIIEYLLSKDIHMDAFINGSAYTPTKCIPAGMKLEAPNPLKRYILQTRVRKEDLIGYIRANNYQVQKMTLNFYPDENGVLVDREEVRLHLESDPSIIVVSGGYNNLEFTKQGVDKGVGLHALADYLGVPIEQTMAIGDTGNDLAIIKAAGFGVAMGNATEEIKEAADYITLSNVEDGVAAAIRKFVL